MAASRGLFPGAKRARAAVVLATGGRAIAGVSKGGKQAPRADGAGESVGSLGGRGSPNSGGQTIMQKVDKLIAARLPRGDKVRGKGSLGDGGFAYDSSMSDAAPESYESRHASKTR